MLPMLSCCQGYGLHVHFEPSSIMVTWHDKAVVNLPKCGSYEHKHLESNSDYLSGLRRLLTYLVSSHWRVQAQGHGPPSGETLKFVAKCRALFTGCSATPMDLSTITQNSQTRLEFGFVSSLYTAYNPRLHVSCTSAELLCLCAGRYAAHSPDCNLPILFLAHAQTTLGPLAVYGCPCRCIPDFDCVVV